MKISKRQWQLAVSDLRKEFPSEEEFSRAKTYGTSYCLGAAVQKISEARVATNNSARDAHLTEAAKLLTLWRVLNGNTERDGSNSETV